MRGGVAKEIKPGKINARLSAVRKMLQHAIDEVDEGGDRLASGATDPGELSNDEKSARKPRIKPRSSL
jgi:hypothetical protein